MYDAALLWNSDLSSDATGDISLAAGTALGQQRVLRRLLTNPGDYVWQPAYGAGLGRFVGDNADPQAIQSAIRSQIFQESCVATSPAPSIDVQPAGNGSIYVNLLYVDAMSGSTQVLSFSVGA